MSVVIYSIPYGNARARAIVYLFVEIDISVSDVFLFAPHQYSTSGVTGRIVELVRLSARCAVRRDSRTVTVDLLQEAGKEFAADLGSERNVSH